MIFDSIYLNYTIIDGLSTQDGFVVKYYTNNNFQGKPRFTDLLNQTYINSGDPTTKWYLMHTQFPIFSIKIAGLVKPPADGIYSFASGLANNLEVWIDDQLVMQEGQTAATLALKGGKWTKVKMLYRMLSNTGMSVVP